MLRLMLWLAIVVAGKTAHADPVATDPRREWQLTLQRLRGESERARIESVNRQINRLLRFGDDRTLWHRDDYWATPDETLQRGRGDCEDYAILKFFSLRALGIAPDKLWLVFAHTRVGGRQSDVTRPHMVLAYYPTPGAEPLILDNLITTLYPASARHDLEPVFSFNRETLRLGNLRYPATQLRKWRAVLKRMETRHETGW